MKGAALAQLRFPRAFAAWSLNASFGQALACVGIAMGFSTLAAFRTASTVHVEDLVFGPGRVSAVDELIAAIGVERTSVLVYMLQRSFDALVVASAVTPIFLWILGASAMHAAARIRGVRGHAFLPILIAFAFASLVYQVPTSTATIVFGAFGSGPGAQLAGAVSLAMLLWFAVVTYRAIQLHYAVDGDRALAILLIGTFAFYLVPLVVILATLVAIVFAAALLQYF
jgi:hypothetical protein